MCKKVWFKWGSNPRLRRDSNLSRAPQTTRPFNRQRCANVGANRAAASDVCARAWRVHPQYKGSITPFQGVGSGSSPEGCTQFLFWFESVIVLLSRFEKKKGPAGNRTRIQGFRVPSDNRYTTGPTQSEYFFSTPPYVKNDSECKSTVRARSVYEPKMRHPAKKRASHL